ncbi:MAG: TlpA family protein disulfide reductase [Proteobacteria bacterium]|nr:TlpA family protein disulfide reductase [Pseudomonadota bacterium]
MAHSRIDFLIGRRLLLAALPAFFAVPALAKVSPTLLTGTLARFTLAKEPKPLPDLAFTDANDKPVTLADYKGKTVLLNFWATWCAPCVKEMPSLDKLQAEMGKDKFVVLPLSLDGPSKPKVAPFYADKKLSNLGIYFDKGKKVLGALDISVLPTSVLVDAQGREIGRMQGDADWDKPEALALMKAAVSA